MHTSTRRARRAMAILALAGCVTTIGTTIGANPAAADGPSPEVKVRVRNRTLLVDGGDASELLTLRSPAATPNLVTVDLGNDGTDEAAVERASFDQVVIRAGGGDDEVRIDETAGVAVPFTDTIPTSIRGGSGDDLMLGGSGAEEFRGGSGNDTVDGNRGNDTAALGAGDDEFIWDPGDGSDAIRGGDNIDVMTFNGAAGNETFTATADGRGMRFTRNVGNIVMDTNGVEEVDLNTLGGSDFVEINDLRRTQVTAINVDAGGTLGVDAPDGVVDSVFINGTDRADTMVASGSAGNVTVTGESATVTLTDVDTIDTLLLSSLGGGDRVDASQLGADTMHLSVNAGDGDDEVQGGAGSDTLNAGAGGDFVDGNRGNDSADLEEGDDEFLWDPGDGSDIVEGRDGEDLMTFNGSGGDEIFAATPIGERLAFTRNLGNIFMDTADVERIDLNALGGADQLTVNDVTGTALTSLIADLGAAIGAEGGDGAVDAITVFGTPGDDVINVSGSPGAVLVAGLQALIDIRDNEPTDSLAIVGNGGTDNIDSTQLDPGTIQLTIS